MEAEEITIVNEVKKSRPVPVFNTKDIRTKGPADRLALLADLERSLSVFKLDGYGRAKAKWDAIVYKIHILKK